MEKNDLLAEVKALRREAKSLRERAKALEAEARTRLEQAQRLEKPKALNPCEVCGRLVPNWGVPGTLQGCHRSIVKTPEGRVVVLYFGAVHRYCDRIDWPKQIQNALARGWIKPNPDGQGYVLVHEPVGSS